MMAPLIDTLRAISGAANVLTDTDTVTGYTTDWTSRWTGNAIAVVRPGSTQEVSAITTQCHRMDVSITPQGGNTGLVGGSIPPPTGTHIVLSTRRLNTITSIDPIGRTITAGAGVTVAAADNAAAAAGLRLGIDLASRDTATLGGIVATNAGGIRVVKHGNTRQQLLGIEAVLADGSILRRMRPLYKDNVGYDIPGLIAGSEGTLAIITSVLLKLVTPAPRTTVIFAALGSVDTALALCQHLREAGLTIEAAELMTAAGIELITTHHNLRPPTPAKSAVYALIEISANGDISAQAATVLQSHPGIIDTAIDKGPARRLWEYRERHTDTIAAATTAPVIKLDVTLPLTAIGAFLEDVEHEVAHIAPSARPIMFGHFLDGNIHVNLLDVPDEDAPHAADTVLRIVSNYNGSISAEHGIGRVKLPWIGLGRTSNDLAAMTTIKRALDPQTILNPGVLFPDPDL